MIHSIISSELREQAGADTYNRYEYQMHWIVNHIISKLEKEEEFLVFCEYHDDMAECENVIEPSCMEFYQVKTSKDITDWKLSELFVKHKRNNGTYKHSFMGFIFYNYIKFGDECCKCNFISNKDFDIEIRKWQSVIKDGKKLLCEQPELYKKIKKSLQIEYENEITQIDFDCIFDKFIQNTFTYKSNMPLENYDSGVWGRFTSALTDNDITISSARLIFSNLVEEIRAKGKHTIKTPISYNDLKKEKGFSSDTFKRIKLKFKNIKNYEEKYNELEKFLLEYNMPPLRKNIILQKLRKHDVQVMDIEDTLYINSIEKFICQCKNVINSKFNDMVNASDLKYIKSFINGPMKQTLELKQPNIDENLLEGLFYEQVVIKSTNML